MIAAMPREDGGNGEWADHGATLIHRLMHAEGPAITACLFASVGKHHVTRRIADRLAGSLKDN